MEDLQQSTSMQCGGFQDKIGKAQEKIRRLQALCEEQNNELTANANQPNPLSEENKYIKKKLVKVQDELKALKV